MTGGIDAISELFAGPGGRAYLGEAVSVATHMLQAGRLAEVAGAPPSLIAAALLHDVGHLIGPTSEDTDARHQETGADWLAALGFPPEVTEPVRLHVAAKRFLCAVEPAYSQGLSPASRRSFALQGGPMTAPEAEAFGQLLHAQDAVAVRRWDEAAKDPNAPTPDLAHFLDVLAAIG
jgi:gamma-butyrobetaine dioxygenase